MRARKRITVGVRFAGQLTPELMQRIGGKLGNPIIGDLLGRVRRGTTEQFSVGLGDGVTAEYPATNETHLKIEI